MAWTDDELGTFEYDDDEGWFQTLKLDSLAAFSYGAADTSVQLQFVTESEASQPSLEAVSLGRTVIRDHHQQ